MDSKLKRLTIIGSMAVILLVSVLVWYLSPQKTKAETKTDTLTPTTTEYTAQDNDKILSQNHEQIGNNLTAFLNDASFFDPKVNYILEMAKDQTNRLSLIVTSVDRKSVV